MSLFKHVHVTLRRGTKNPAKPPAVNAVASGKSRPTRGWRTLGRKQFAAGIAVIAASAALLTATPGSPANAVGFSSSSAPIYVADKVWNVREVAFCTVGAVLRPRVTVGDAADNLRWLLLAGHCGEVGDVFRSDNREILGTVDWKSSNYDLLTVKVPAAMEQYPTTKCFFGGGGSAPPTRYCVPAAGVRYIPRAKGIISCIGSQPRVTNWTGALPQGISSAVRFCGSATGRDLFYKPYSGTVAGPTPAGSVVGQIGRFPWTEAQGYLNGNGMRATGGDSGGPVFVLDARSNTARIYGIQVTTRTALSTGKNDITVIPLARYFDRFQNRLSTMIASG